MATKTESNGSNRRRRYFVDPEIQGALLRQAFQCWLWASATFAGIIFVYRVIPSWYQGTGDGSENIWHHLGPYLIACGTLFPIVVFNTLRFSNRFVGPMVRVRRALKELAEGGAPREIVLRPGDFWLDVAADINAVSAARRAETEEATADTNADVAAEHEAYVGSDEPELSGDGPSAQPAGTETHLTAV